LAFAAERQYRWPNVRGADLKAAIERNAAEIARLHERVHETAQTRSKDGDAWRRACEEFRTRYDTLSFPGGYEGAGARILAGDASTIEAALCFLELRPYFFRSGYMNGALKRKLKRATLDPTQAERLRAVLERDAAWRSKNRGSSLDPPLQTDRRVGRFAPSRTRR
jgi:hypothetical protein